MVDKLPELARFSKEYAHLSRILAYRQKEYSVAIADHKCKLQLSPCDNQPSMDCRLLLNINNVSVALELDSGFVSLLLPWKLGDNVLLVPNDLLMAALHYSLDSTLQQLANVFNVPFSLSGVEAGKANGSSIGLMITVNTGGSVCTGRLEANDTIIALLNKMPSRSSSKAKVPFLASIALGRSLLTKIELNSIVVGDVVFLQQRVDEQHLIIRLNRNTAFIGEVKGSQVIIQQRMPPMDDEQDSDPEEQQKQRSLQESQEQDGVDLSDLSVELLFEVGQQQFSVNDLQSLQPGFIFELDRSIDQPVRIRVNGKVVAECELVQIENRLGAKVIRLK